MRCNITIDKTKSLSTAQDIPAFPWVKADAGKFVWEEMFIDNSLISLYHSAMGRCSSRERAYCQYRNTDILREHLAVFELEVNGQLLRGRWKWTGDKLETTGDGFKKLTVDLEYDDMPIKVQVHSLLDGSSFLVRWLEIYNMSREESFALSRVFPWCTAVAIKEGDTSILTKPEHESYLLGRYKSYGWGMEGEFGWEKLNEGTMKIEATKTNFNPPMFIVKNEYTGEHTIIHFECSGSFQAEFTNSFGNSKRIQCPWKNDYVHVKIGLAGKAPYRILYPGESASTPPVHISMLYGDLDSCVNELHEHLRCSVIPKQPAGIPHPIEYNHTGYTANAQISRQLLMDEVDVAASIGIELFLVDAGWYGPKEKHWTEAAGEWYENPLLEGGLKDIYDYARKKGMKCGIWLPIEWANKQSVFAKKFIDGYIGGENSIILDVTNPEVEAYMFETITGVIEKYKLDCFRIDDGYDAIKEKTNGRCVEDATWRYYDALHRLFEKVRQRFPGLMLENCSGGGGRVDLGMMRRFHWTQITDNWKPDEQVRILNGLTMALPPEQCMPLIGAINMRPADTDFVVRVGMLGHFTASGVFPVVEKSNQYGLERWKHGIDLYKKEIRPMLSSCRVYHHTPLQDYTEKGEWVVMEYASKERSKAVVGLFRLAGSGSDTFHFRAKGLDLSKDYALDFDNTDEQVKISGFQLCTSGIDIRIPGTLMSEILIIRQQTAYEERLK